jgi:predicted PurR-regulated permease PerM
MRRYGMSKSSAILWTLVSVVALYLFVSVALIEAGFGMRAKLPIYEEHIQALYQKVIVFLGAHGIQSAALTSKSLYDSSRILSFVEMILPKLLGFVSDRVIVSALSLIFLIEIAEIEDGAKSPLARTLLYYGQDVQRFIAISAQTGAITAVANLALLIALRVDFPIMWCVLYFFLHFIPNIGFLISLVPPVVLALLTFGWKRALFVAIGLIVTQMISDYALQPVLMKKGLHISFLESLLSLLVWGFLLVPRELSWACR